MHILWLLLSPPLASSLAPIKSRMKTFWYHFTRVVLENGHGKGVVVGSLRTPEKN